MHVHVLTSFYKLLHDTWINKVIIIIIVIIVIVVVIIIIIIIVIIVVVVVIIIIIIVIVVVIIIIVIIVVVVVIIIIMLGPFVGRWRSQGVASIMCIDDGISGCSSKQQASEASHSIQSAEYAMPAGRLTTKSLVGSQNRLENGSGLL